MINTIDLTSNLSIDMPFVYALIFLAIFSLVLLWTSHKFCKSGLLSEGWEAGDHDLAIRFQRRWLTVYFLVQLAQWIQTPYLFRLYASYGFAHSEIVTFFLLTYASSAVVGTAVGSLADRLGRKNGCYTFLILFTVSTVAKFNTQNAYKRVATSHLIDGVALSLLYTSFESWMVSENFASCFPQSHLHRTFELGSILNGAIAVVAGIFASLSLGFIGDQFGPFWFSLLPIVLAGFLMRDWDENYGAVASIQACPPLDIFKRDNKILLLGLAQTFFDSAMYVVRYAWMPALAMGKEYPQSYGIVFAALMVSVMIGGICFSMARRSILCVNSGNGDSYGTGTSFARVALPAHVAAFLCLLGTVVMFDIGGVAPLFWCFVGVEICYGYWWPCFGVMRSEFLPETHRSTVMNLFLVPRNVVVALALIYNSYLSTLSSATSIDKSTEQVVAGAAGGVLGASGAGIIRDDATTNGTQVDARQTLSGSGSSFEKTLAEGHAAARELLIVGIVAFAISLIFAVLLFRKTSNGTQSHSYKAISLDESNVTNEFEEDFGDLVDDFDMYNDQNDISQSSSLRREENHFFDDEDDNLNDDDGFDGF